ncbi:uncharacterized protein LOC110181554 [Drosophila serrata]|uniref:uncharacterized protein LOC110181554 n=1 Tax=Drosophila serrata TaxID=7274 RepID=UPI000A1CFD81|nr:uncharacterized protein LOC110181554 [Drosophila serrata]
MSQEFDKPEYQDFYVDDDAIVEFLERSLAQVLVETAQIKVDLEELQEEQKKLQAEHEKSCLSNVPLDIFPDEMNLMPRLQQVTEQAEELLAHVTKLIDAKANVKKSYYQDNDEGKDATKKNLKTLHNLVAYKSVKETIYDSEHTVTDDMSSDEELSNLDEECDVNNVAMMMEEMDMLNQIHKQATESMQNRRLEAGGPTDGFSNSKILERYMLAEAPSKEEPSN